MNYQETIAYLYNRLPMFHRIGKAAYKADLSNTIALCNHLGRPQDQFKSIHIAGTNGKGSTSHVLAAILQAAGYRTGLYTSPHLKSFTERIRVNGMPIEEEAVITFVEQNQAIIEQIKPSFFELTVAMAFEYFKRQQVDIAVIEVGLGGRLDSTNVIMPQLSVITNISFDHQDILGHTLTAIATEKAGIIKKHVPVVISEFQEEVAPVFKAKAQEEEAPLYFATGRYQTQDKGYKGLKRIMEVYKEGKPYLSGLECQLTGDYQLKNTLGILQTVDLLRELGYTINESQLRKAFAQVSDLTGLKGRWQVLHEQPLIICDTGHNEAGIKHVAGQLAHLSYENLYIVLGMVNDKDLGHVLPLLPTNAYYFFCQAQIPRALNAAALQQEAATFGLQGEVVFRVNEALAAAKQKAKPNDVIFVGGSTFVVAEIDEL